MDYKEIKDLMKEMNQSNLTKLKIEKGDCKIVIEKVPTKIETVTVSSSNTNNENNEEKVKEKELEGQQILSPMVGTFYASPAPGKEPFVKIGDKVKKGQTLCIVEAMKLMNEIESEYDGEIIDIIVENEEMVEYGQPLFLIR